VKNGSEDVLARRLPALKRGLIFERIGPSAYILTDPASRERFQCSSEESFILGYFNGQTATREMILLFEGRFGKGLEPERLEELAVQLDRCGLLEGACDQQSTLELKKPLSPQDEEKLNGRIDFLLRYLGWLLNPIVAILVLAAALVGIVVLVKYWSDFTGELRSLFYERGPALVLLTLSLTQTVFFLDLPRELVTGMICRKLGGRIADFRLRWLGGLIPCFWCEYGASVFLVPPARRWILLFSGYWTILAVFGLSAIFWHASPPGSFLRYFWLILPLPAVLIFVLNCTIFLRLDAYRILCYWAKDWRLMDRAWAETTAWLGGKTSPEPLESRERFWLRMYGLGYFVWLLISYGIIVPVIFIWFMYLADGLGVFCASYGFLWWHRSEIQNYMEKFYSTKKILGWWHDPRNAREVRIVKWAFLLAIIFFPYSDDVEGGCRIVSKANYGARAQIDDRIAEIKVKEGDSVQAGDLLARLDGQQVTLDLKRAQDELVLQRANIFYWEGQLSRTMQLRQTSSATEQQYQDALRGRDETLQKEHTAEASVAYWQNEAQQIEIRTPIAGRVALPDTQFKANQWVQKGDLIAVVEDPKNLAVQIASNEQAGSYCAVGMPIHIRLYALDGMLRTGHVTNITTGPVAYSSFNDEPYRTDKERQHGNQNNTVEDRYLRVYGDFDAAPDKLMPGMTGFARIRMGYTPLIVAVARPIWRFMFTDFWSWLP
jgi:multidrug resistance efflux pump